MDKYSTKIHILSSDKKLEENKLRIIVEELKDNVPVNGMELETLENGWKYYLYTIYKLNSDNIIEITDYYSKKDDIKDDVINYIANRLRTLRYDLEILWDETVDDVKNLDKPNDEE